MRQKIKGVSLRPFKTSDFEDIARIVLSKDPSAHVSGPMLRLAEETTGPEYRRFRIIAQDEHRIVGFAEYKQPPWMYNPNNYWITIGLDADYEGRGLEEEFYEQLINKLAPLNPVYLFSTALETNIRLNTHLKEWGFTEVNRRWPSVLDLRSFSEEPFVGSLDSARTRGVYFKTLEEFRQADSKYLDKMYQLECETSKDIPRAEPFSITRQIFEDLILKSPNMLFDGYYLAVVKQGAEERIVGVSNLESIDHKLDSYGIDITAVHRDFRRTGVATALKLLCIRYAKAKGIHFLQTTNDFLNQPILKLNEKMGFRKSAARIEYRKVMK